jgi:hypothetical protein
VGDGEEEDTYMSYEEKDGGGYMHKWVMTV